MVRRIVCITCMLCSSLLLLAQQTLNLHTTAGEVICFTFAENPKVTFPAPDTLKVSSENLTVEFPFDEIKKMTFVDGLTDVETLTVKKQAQTVSIYDITGKLLRKMPPKGKSVTVDLSAVPSGIYIVNDGKRTYKVLKK